MALAAEISTRTVCARETPAKTRSAAKKVIWQRNSSFMEFSQKGYCYDLIWRKQLKGELACGFVGVVGASFARLAMVARMSIFQMWRHLAGTPGFARSRAI